MMFSALNSRVTQLEGRVKNQEDITSTIHRVLIASDDTGDTDGSKVSPSTSKLILRLQAQVKETQFRVNDLSSKVSKHADKLEEVKVALRSSSDGKDGCNPCATEFHPSRMCSVPNSPMPIGGPWRSPREMTTPPIHDSPLSAMTPDLQPPHVSNDHPYQLPIDYLTEVESSTHGGFYRNLSQSPQDFDPGHEESQIGFQTRRLLEEIASCKRQTREFEAQLTTKNHLLQEISLENEQLSTKEREHSQKQEWYEHKMRLLKQDKRRRGETIGKLLRCIDDMKDQGRVDDSKVTEGSYVLQATLTSRGWPAEDRVRAAVQAMEAERAALRAQLELDNVPVEVATMETSVD